MVGGDHRSCLLETKCSIEYKGEQEGIVYDAANVEFVSADELKDADSDIHKWYKHQPEPTLAFEPKQLKTPTNGKGNQKNSVKKKNRKTSKKKNENMPKKSEQVQNAASVKYTEQTTDLPDRHRTLILHDHACENGHQDKRKRHQETSDRTKVFVDTLRTSAFQG
jgi:hypothetical protein